MTKQEQIQILIKDKVGMLLELDKLREDMQFLQAAIWNTEFSIDKLKEEVAE